MNSLSYGCPELLEGEDGLSDAARAERQRKWEEVYEPIRTEQAKKEQSTETDPSHSATTTPPPAYNSVIEDACTESLKRYNQNCITRPPVVLKPKTEWTYIAHCFRYRDEGAYDIRQYLDMSYLDPNTVMWCWRCGSCKAILLFWLEGEVQFEDGFCGRCGTLNRKPPGLHAPVVERPMCPPDVPQPPMPQPPAFDDDGKPLYIWPPLNDTR
jgi:hypothetical protein